MIGLARSGRASENRRGNRHSGRRARLRAAGVPLRQARCPRGGGPTPRRRCCRLVRRNAMRPAACHGLEALAASGTERGYPSSIGSGQYREAALEWMSRRFGVDGRAGRRRLHRHEGVRLRRAPLVASADARARHGALPGSCLPDLRDGCDPRPVPGCCGPDLAGRQNGPVVDLAGRRRPGAVLVGQQSGQPGGPTRGSWRRCALGPRQRCARLLRRVLRRVHLGRACPHDPRARLRRRRRRPLALETVQLRRAQGRLLRRGR